MARALKNAVWETFVTTGTGALTPTGVVPGKGAQSFATAYSSGDTMTVTAEKNGQRQTFLATWNGTTLARTTTEYSTSGGTTDVNFLAGTGTVFVDLPASYQQASLFSQYAGSVIDIGANRSTNPLLKLDFSAASVVTGLKILGSSAGGSVVLSAISSAADENLTIDSKGSGAITLGANSTGGIILNRGVSCQAGITAIGGRSTFAANNEAYALGVRYTVLDGSFYFGATHSATPDGIFANAAGTAVLYLGNDRVVSIPSGGALNIGGATTIKHIGGTGAGIWYDGPTTTNRFFLGQDASTDNIFRLYADVLGANVFTYDYTARHFLFSVGEKVKINTVSNLFSEFLAVASAAQAISALTSSTTAAAIIIRTPVSSGVLIGFQAGPVGDVGSITQNGTVTAYNTTSDARKKVDPVALSDPWGMIDRFSVYDHGWLGHKHRSVGIYAQEAVGIIPDMIRRGDDDMALREGDEGFVSWHADYSKGVPVLIADAQEAHRRIRALEAETSELKLRLAA